MSSGTMTIEPSTAHKATVIFVHGLGHSNLTWRNLVLEKLVETCPYIKWVFPQAIDRAVTLDKGDIGPSWFDIATLPPGDDENDKEAIMESIAVINGLILQEKNQGCPIALVGFSQGASLCQMTMLSTSHGLAGVVSLCGWLPNHARKLTAASTVPVLWCHGGADDRIPVEYGQDAVSFLTNVGFPVTFLTYEGMAHTTNDEEMRDLGNWLDKIFEGKNIE
ncbi:phospholipase carboxylesterase [Mycena floridula]|nr:phospholipase carboxylesterase [Mycena floridula]